MEPITKEQLDWQASLISQAEYHIEALERMGCDMDHPYRWIAQQIEEHQQMSQQINN